MDSVLLSASRPFSRLKLGVLILLAALSGWCHAAPNIIFVLLDDMNYAEEQYMPAYQTLVAAQGMQFTRSYTVTPFCCPARASILRGQYPHNHGVYGNGGADGGFKRFYDSGLETETLATWMQGLGYRTGLFGKYLNNYGLDRGLETHVPPGWDDWRALVRQPYTDVTLVENGTLVKYARTDYQADILASQVGSFIEHYLNDPRPFFVYFAPTAPHSPWQPAERHKGVYAGLTAPRPPSFNEEDIGDKPAYVQANPLLGTTEIAKIDSAFAQRMESLLAVDEAIASMMDALTQIGQLDNTYIFFTSDNGWHQGEHRLLETKGVPYEESIRMPLGVRGPGVAVGGVRDELVLNIDFAPTFIELAGGTMPGITDGRSLVPLLHAQPVQWRKRFLIESLSTSQSKIPQFRAMRTQRNTYVDYYNTNEKELYDMTVDPYQLTNVYSRTGAALQNRLASELEALRNCVAASCRTADQ